MELLGFPDPVNETSARIVAAGVVVEAVAFLVVGEGWLLVPLVYGFVARVLAGPRFSPLARFVTHVVTPRLRIEHVSFPVRRSASPRAWASPSAAARRSPGSPARRWSRSCSSAC